MGKSVMYNVVIIDDEIDSINVITNLLGSFSSTKFKISGTATNLEEGIEQIKKFKPEIVFLDVDMPGKNGLAIYDYFGTPDFKIIFVTAYQQYALDALKKSASDYLLKPINIIELKESLLKVTKTIEKDRRQEELSDKINYLSNSGIDGKNIILDIDGGFIMENTSDIEYCYADQSYSVIVTYANKEIVVSKSLKQLQDMLPSNQFYRTHKSYLINVYYIRKFIRASESYIVLKSGTKIPVSVRTSVIISKEIKQMLLA